MSDTTIEQVPGSEPMAGAVAASDRAGGGSRGVGGGERWE